MASIELSAGVMSGLPARIVNPNTSLNFPSGVASQTNVYNMAPLMPYLWDSGGGGGGAANYNYTSWIGIYQGAVPTDFTGLTTQQSRNADRLIFLQNNGSTTFWQTSVFTTNPVVINSTYVTATVSGTATWFRLLVGNSSIAGGTLVVYQIIGTVGATGSGADLEIPSTAIVSGRAYRIQNLRIQFPSSWSY